MNRKIAIVFALILVTGCATSKIIKTIHIDSDPQGAHISVDGTYLGDTPLSRRMTWKRWNLEGGMLGVRVFKAEKRGYVTKEQVLPISEVPDKMFFTLATVEEHGVAKGGAQQQMQQQMQGPTIVIPGSGGQPIQVTPGGTK